MIDIFVSLPYTHPDPSVTFDRLELAERYMVYLIRQGHTPYSTIQSMSPLAIKYGLRDDYGFWEEHCHKMICASHEMHVLMIDGWNESTGVQAEITWAEHVGKDILYVGNVQDITKEIYIRADLPLS